MDARGFTLLELLVVMVLVGLLGGIALPRLNDAFVGPSVRAAALDVAAVLRAARSQAVTQGTATLFRYDPRTRQMAITDRPRGAALAESLEVVFGNPNAPQAIPGIAFFPDGSSSGGQVALSQGRQSYIIAVDWLTGRAAIHAH